MKKSLAWIGSGLLGVAVGVFLLTARERALHSRAAVRERYREYPALVLEITEPIQVNQVATFEDGGTTSITLIDATGRKFHACIDGREWGGPDDMYIGAAYPTDQGAQKVSKRGQEEAALLGLLIRWCEADPERSAVYEMTSEQFLEWVHRDGRKGNLDDYYIRNACGLLKFFEKRFGGVY